MAKHQGYELHIEPEFKVDDGFDIDYQNVKLAIVFLLFRDEEQQPGEATEHIENLPTWSKRLFRRYRRGLLRVSEFSMEIISCNLS